MAFNNRSEFISAQASEKLTLAHVHATARLHLWTVYVGTIWSRSVSYFVTELKVGTVALTKVANKGSVTPGTFAYEPAEGKVYVNMSDSSDPNLSELIATHRFFYASGPTTLSWDLTDTGDHVYYDGRIEESPGFKHKVGVDQKLVSIAGQGSLKLENNDGGLDDIYDTLIFENQIVEIYSWSRTLPFSESSKIYKGRITNKRYNTDSVVFKVKDAIFDLLQSVPQVAYDDNDNVLDSVKGRYKRWIYGRVDGLKLQSIDQIKDGYLINGTASSTQRIKQVTRFENFPAASSFPGTGIGAYFTINSALDENKYVYWYDVDNNNSKPSLGTEYTYVQINVSSSDNSDLVSETTSIKLSSNFNIIPGTGYFNAENKKYGLSTQANAGSSGITISTPILGSSGLKITGTSTTFLADVSPNDNITLGTQEFKVSSVESDTSLTLDDLPDYPFIGLPITLKPEIPTVTKNRVFFVAGHACAKLTKTITQILQLNRIVLNDTEGLNAGDFVEFDTGERIEIKNTAPGNIIVLRKNIVLQPSLSSNVIRQPIQNLFVESDDVNSDKFTISNIAGETKVTLTSDVEFNIARNQGLGFTATFTNGSRTVSTSGQPDLTAIIKPRDWIQPTNIAYTTYYEVLQVSENTITLRVPFADPTITGTVDGKLPNYIGDTTIVSANVLGKTSDGQPAGSWIKTGSDAVKDLLSSINITDIDTASFTQAAQDNTELLSLTIPLTPEGRAVSVKNIIDKINKSINSALTLNKSLQLQYRTLLPEVSDTPVEINDNQVVNWSITSVNGDMIRNSLIRYRHRDVDRYTQESGNNAISYSSDFVEKYVGTNTTQELDVYLYNERSAEIMSHREVYFRSLARAEIRIETDLRLENLDIGDHVVLNFERLYKRFGDKASRKKVCIIVGKTVTGEKVELFCSDFGNILNRSSIITPNTAPDWTLATSDEKLKYGYITTANGLVNDEEETANTHLIT